MAQKNTIPVLEETIPPIVVSLRHGRRFATPQEARAISALQDVLDDQPPPAKAKFERFDWAATSSAAPAPTAAKEIPKEVKPVYRAVAPSRKTDAPVFKEIVVRVMPIDRSPQAGNAPAFVAPAFERVAAEMPVTTRDEMLAVAEEVAARAAPFAAVKVEDVVKVADLMPFGQATLRLFCC